MTAKGSGPHGSGAHGPGAHGEHGSGAHGSSARDPGAKGPRGAKGAILVVDDDAGALDALTDILEVEGYAVTQASDGRRALEALQGGARPAVIVLDLMMPVMDGWEFRQKQLGDPAVAEIPVVVVSATDISQPDTLRAVEYLRKPVDVDELLEAIEKAIGGKPRRGG